MPKSLLQDKSYSFALRIVKLYQYLSAKKGEFVLSKQILRSGTAIGSLIREAEFGQSRADFTSKLNIALKEANETDYWLRILRDSGYITERMFASIQPECQELIRLLAASVKTLRTKGNANTNE